MISTVILATVFLIGLGFFTAENIASVIVGFLATLGVTQFIKSWNGLRGFGATVLALVVSFAVGLVSVLLQMAFSGEFSPEKLGVYALSIFTTATVVYRLIKSAAEKAE